MIAVNIKVGPTVNFIDVGEESMRVWRGKEVGRKIEWWWAVVHMQCIYVPTRTQLIIIEF